MAFGFNQYFNPAGYNRGNGAPSPVSTSGSQGGQSNLYTKGYGIIDPAVDEQWGAYFSGNASDNTYYDYFFSGQDVKVYIDGADDFDLNIQSVSWKIVQQKMLLYGYNSYTYDSVARGQRVIQGAFSLYFKSPQYLMQAIAQSAKTRATNKGALMDQYSRGLTEDDANIQQYWANDLDPTLASEGVNLFSNSPPFSLVVLYGIQDVSSTEVDTADYWQNYASNDTLLFDQNDRIVSTNTTTQRVIIDDIELTQMDILVDGSGFPVVENYTFTARDYYVPSNQS